MLFYARVNSCSCHCSQSIQLFCYHKGVLHAFITTHTALLLPFLPSGKHYNLFPSSIILFFQECYVLHTVCTLLRLAFFTQHNSLEIYPSCSLYQFSSVAQSCPTLCDPIECSTPGFPVHNQLPEPAQTHVHWVSDAIQPSHPLLSPSPQSCPASGSFPVSQFFASGSQSIGVSASASVLPMNIQDWFLLGLIGLIPLQSKGLSRNIVHSFLLLSSSPCYECTTMGLTMHPLNILATSNLGY